MTLDADTLKSAVFTRCGGGRFQIGVAALGKMLGHRQDQRDAAEAGGILLGRHIRDTADIVVDRVTSPLPGDRRARSRFVRARRLHQDEIDLAWRESGGTTTYLGEWHTHPESQPWPSLIDWLGWQRKLLIDRFTGVLFFIIVGASEIQVWEGHRYGRPKRLRRA